MNLAKKPKNQKPKTKNQKTKQPKNQTTENPKTRKAKKLNEKNPKSRKVTASVTATAPATIISLRLAPHFRHRTETTEPQRRAKSRVNFRKIESQPKMAVASCRRSISVYLANSSSIATAGAAAVLDLSQYTPRSSTSRQFAVCGVSPSAFWLFGFLAFWLFGSRNERTDGFMMPHPRRITNPSAREAP